MTTPDPTDRTPRSAPGGASVPGDDGQIRARARAEIASEGEGGGFGPDWRAVWAARLSPRALSRLCYGLVVGFAGGWLADAAGMPLAWMLGALFACMAFSIAGQPVMVPVWFRMGFMGLIGLFLGESFTAEAAGRLAQWPITIAMAVLYVPAGAFVCYMLFRYAARMSRGTALLSGLPGGMTAVAIFAHGLGGDERRVALSQSMRVAFVVLLAPAIAFGLLGLPAPTAETFKAAHPISLPDAAILMTASLAVGLLAARWKMPLPYLIGPMFASAALRFPGIVEGQLPAWMVEMALLVGGASIGTRFAGVGGRVFLATLAWTFAGTVLLMAVSGLFALAATAVLDVDLFAALLAFAPGGVAEMSLIAIAIDADPGFVATHHMARIFAILFSLPLIAARLGRFIGYEPQDRPGPPGG